MYGTRESGGSEAHYVSVAIGTMSGGRWRSRHWRPEEARGDDNRGPAFRGAGSHFSNRRDTETSHPQNPQHSSRNYHRDEEVTASQHCYGPPRGGGCDGGRTATTWQRGQSLPQQQRPLSDRQHTQYQPQSNSSSQRDPPSRHHGNGNCGDNRASLSPSKVTPRMDSSNSNHRASLAPSSSAPIANAWRKQQPAPPSADDRSFPSLTAASSTPAAVEVQKANKGLKQQIDLVKNCNYAPASSLPATSSWGKTSHSFSGLAAAPTNTAPTKLPSSEIVSKKESHKRSGEEFPSLSASLDASSHRKQHHFHPITAAAATDAKQVVGSSSSNKKSAGAPAVHNLASFLSSPLEGGGGKKGKGVNGETKKGGGTAANGNNNNNKSGKTFQTAPNSTTTTTSSKMMMMTNTKKHPRDDKLATTHTTTSSNHLPQHTPTTTTSGGSGVSSPPMKKGRQRIAPQKKKLTTLKKRVLEERLRIWKEQHDAVNVVDDSMEVSVAESAAVVVAAATAAKYDDDNVRRNINMDESHQTTNTNEKNAKSSTTLLIENFINPNEDDLTDNDEYDELTTNLISLAGRVGKVVSVYIPRPLSSSSSSSSSKTIMEKTKDNNLDDDECSLLLLSPDDESNHVGLSFVRFATCRDAFAARDILNGVVVSGQKLRTNILYSKELEYYDCELCNSSDANAVGVVVVPPSEENELKWRCATLKAIIEANHQISSSSLTNDHLRLNQDGHDNNVGVIKSSPKSTVTFHNILSSDDYEDEDALEESIEDIKGIASQYGHVVDAYGDTPSSSGDETTGNVYVVYYTPDIATFAAQKLDGMLLGGIKISVSVDGGSQQAGLFSTVVLTNVLSEDDFEDEDCLNESIGDIRTLAEKYGVVGSVVVDTSSRDNEERGKVRVEYTGGTAVAEEAAKQLNGVMFGGKFISATVLSSGVMGSNEEESHNAPLPVQDDINVKQVEPMFSGNKVIPERFAECKRVPKVPNSGIPRSYATKIADEGAVPLLTEMLGELMRLQERSKDQKNARSRRRIVMGLREVARGIRAHKVKMVVCANNLDEYGAIDSKLQEILDLAHSEEVPVVFELNKRKLGKAVGKSIKVSVVGIQNVSGAEQQFKQLKRMAGVA